MAKGYRPVRRDQPFLLPPDMREWLAEAHPVWLVIDGGGRSPGYLGVSRAAADGRAGDGGL